MGQCYSVDARFNFASKVDEMQFCELVLDGINKEREKNGARFRPAMANASPLAYFQVMTTDNARRDADGLYHAGFDGSYSWDGVMERVFCKAFPALADGSWLTILGWDDDGFTIFRKKRGDVWVTYVDTYHDECETRCRGQKVYEGKWSGRYRDEMEGEMK